MWGVPGPTPGPTCVERTGQPLVYIPRVLSLECFQLAWACIEALPTCVAAWVSLLALKACFLFWVAWLCAQVGCSCRFVRFAVVLPACLACSPAFVALALSWLSCGCFALSATGSVHVGVRGLLPWAAAFVCRPAPARWDYVVAVWRLLQTVVGAVDGANAG